MQRDPAAILRAHEMDPQRRELYVEGRTDRTFFLWLVKGSIHPNAAVKTIDTVDIPGVPTGGERGRLLSFAGMVAMTNAQILCVADADTDRIRGVQAPHNVVFTDFRDAEGYFLNELCINKVIQLGLSNDELRASELLAAVSAVARWIAALRLLSDERQLALPFQSVDLSRSAHYNRQARAFSVDKSRYVQTLLQTAGRPQRETTELIADIELKRIHLEQYPDHRDVIHGKDALILLDIALHAYGMRQNQAFPTIRASIELGMVDNHPAIRRIIEFLTGGA